MTSDAGSRTSTHTAICEAPSRSNLDRVDLEEASNDSCNKWPQRDSVPRVTAPEIASEVRFRLAVACGVAPLERAMLSRKDAKGGDAETGDE